MKPSELTWRIYYADGSTFDSSQGEPEDAPSIGIIAIKHFIENEWRISAFVDYYIREQGEWWGADAPGFWQYMFRPGFKVVKFGTNIKDEPFNKIMAEARNDTEGGMPKIT
jgi:hypothetical protein